MAKGSLRPVSRIVDEVDAITVYSHIGEETVFVVEISHIFTIFVTVANYHYT